MKRLLIFCILACALGFAVFMMTGCENTSTPTPKSTSGVQKTTVKVETGADNLTSEQRNVKDRLLMDNKPGAIKHLYVVSAWSGDCILHSTVREKVTSSGKRLSPTSVLGSWGTTASCFTVNFGGVEKYTTEVLQDDGTYGSSIPYIFWWDVRGNYHQHYIAGGQIVHVSDVPMSWPKIILNLEAQ